MARFSEAETLMWDDAEAQSDPPQKDHEIDAKYQRGEQRIVTESNREKLPNFVNALKKPGYLDLRPFYQRRARWDRQRQSKLIESFIMNVPVPPIFLYEKQFNRYEVMDGQQRITAIQDFYDNSLKLVGLESWPELNGRTYKTLPPKVRAGVDRRSIASIVLLKESAPDDEAALLLKRIVFERLNTGGVRLSRQEIRNCLYYGELNKLLLRASQNDAFRTAWGIPDPPEEDQAVSKELADNTMYKKMEDAELVLRFFALRHYESFHGAMQDFLDRYMIRSMKFEKKDFEYLEQLFDRTIEACASIYGGRLFHPFDVARDEWANRPQKSFADAVMVGMSKHLGKAGDLIAERKRVLEATKALFQEHPEQTFTGAGNTKADVQNRIELFSKMLSKVVKE